MGAQNMPKISGSSEEMLCSKCIFTEQMYVLSQDNDQTTKKK